jgi:hypothetical protein
VRVSKSVARAVDIAPIVADIKASGAVSLRRIAAGLNEHTGVADRAACVPVEHLNSENDE